MDQPDHLVARRYGWRQRAMHMIFLMGLGLMVVLPASSLPADDTFDADATRLVLLGTGTPNADPDRSGPGIAIVVNDQAYLVDAGAGIVRRAAAAAKKHHIDALNPDRLTRLFLTHLHSDHTIGLADVILTSWVLEREVPLQIYGPEGTRAMVANLLAAYQQDITNRLDGLTPIDSKGPNVLVTDIKPGIVYEDQNLSVEAIPVNHGSWSRAYGYRFRTADRTIVVSGDTAPSQALIDACDGCDILLHEVYSDAGFRRREPEWQKYHAAFHTSASQLARIAQQSQPGLLVLYHQLFWGTSEEQLLEEVRAGYQGEVVSGDDLDIY